ncbi:GTP 3',8-cyclase MoaA [Alicyclobacillus mengziensis]|uniref:GTP 3',8-cyclase n=1 Tax=Alicyclobacillus mengziensis TaxID=2931921 RepID=A0A9X7Z9N9_9BACL|nr:GTP 3',8-cyclase MoaA [Alicyclobacillus mengziensis]QSO49863.1 GTP 3',8-cyclase MoaA [Alicyclobacillus mengziensis]
MRPLRDLRVSLTDRCNFRCRYCMPKEVFGADFAFLPHHKLLTFEEITRLTGLFQELGVRKVRLTGGEPLLRKNVDDLVRMLNDIGVDDIALTTNGSALNSDLAKRLKTAGLRRITISLDSLRDEVFMAMNDVHFPVSKVLAAIEAAKEADLNPVKINMVVKKGWNESSILEMADYFRGSGCILRLIEFMDVGSTNGWRLADVVTAEEMVSLIQTHWPIHKLPPNYAGEVALRYEYEDGQGEIGVIASVTQAFCGACTRARLSPEGKLYTCLFGANGLDLRALLRSGASDDDIRLAIHNAWLNRDDRYSELRSSLTFSRTKVEMSHIGG